MLYTVLSSAEWVTVCACVAVGILVLCASQLRCPSSGVCVCVCVPAGILVLNAREGGPAWRAGIRGTSRDEYGRLVLGDIITAINGQKIRNSSDLYKVLDKSTVSLGQLVPAAHHLEGSTFTHTHIHTYTAPSHPVTVSASNALLVFCALADRDNFVFTNSVPPGRCTYS